MKRIYLCLVALLTLVGAVAADEKDITQTYVLNASFEADAVANLAEVTNSADGRRGWTLANPEGWTVSGTAVTQLLVKSDCYADNNFGQVTTVADGEAAYYLRQGWAEGTTKVAQTLKNLPAGKYKLTIDHRTGYANSATSSLTLSAGATAVTESFVQGSAGFFATAPWKTSEVVFSTASAGDVEIAVKADWLSGGSCVMMDNIRLYELSDDYVEPEQPDETDVESPTEGVITHDFVPEAQMKDDLLQMLANFSLWMKNDFQPCEAPNSIGEVCGCFRGENTMANDERGVRPNADLSMICAFLVKYAKDKVTLPEGVTWAEVEDMAMQSLVFAYSTHKANRLKVCKGNNYWGSTSKNDYTWESSLWAMSVAYSAYFQWDKLTDEQKGYIYALLKAECNYELERSIPTGYVSDSKAEENGWEADVLAAALGLFPNDELAPRWFARLREFAINSYSHYADATDKTITWSTSDPAVATVANGVVTAITPGTATITARAGNKEATCVITVEERYIPLTGIVLDPTEVTIEVGALFTITATLLPENTSEKTVSWTTSDRKIVTVRRGVIEGKAPGTAIITASNGDIEATCVVTVTPADGIEQATLNAVKIDIYDITGRPIRLGATSTGGLQRGIYIINGRKTIVK